MRVIAPAFGLSVLLSQWACAAQALEYPHGSVTSARSGNASMADIERKAEKAVREQQTLDRKFDASVRRATSLVCSGCLTEPTAAAPIKTHRTKDRLIKRRQVENGLRPAALN